MWSGASISDIRVVGINTDTYRAGRIELCMGEARRAVCAEGWDEHAATVVCRHLRSSTPINFIDANCPVLLEVAKLD